jgi:hypothetical protein
MAALVGSAYYGAMLGYPLNHRMALLSAATMLVGVSLQAACRPLPPVALDDSAVSLVGEEGSVPQHVRRLAVWYPRTWEQDVSYGYTRLEQAAFQLKRQRSGIKIVERRNLDQLADEQRLQLSGRVGDDSAIRVGRWLGADSMVVFRIDGPTWRERLLARFYGKMPPFVVSSKIISLESGEVLYHDVVSAVPVPASGEWGDYGSDYELQPALHSALDHALSMAIAHLHRSFR